MLGFSIKGHSGQGYAGNDILCAAVSSAAFLVANTVTDVLHLPAQISVKDGLMELVVEQKDARRCRDLFAGFKLHLLGLEEEYPKNMKVSTTEV